MILARHKQEKLPPEYKRKCSQSFCMTGILKCSGISTATTQIPRIWQSHGWPARMVRVITTNFDRVLEEAFAATGTSFHRCFQAEDFRALASDLTG